MRTSLDDSAAAEPAPLRLDTVNEWVCRGTRTLKLTPKAFAVLRYLAERSGQLVGKQELLDALWSGTVVVEAVLATVVREIRKELGDDATQPWLIETVHRRGYRLIADVALDAGRVAAGSEAAPLLPEPGPTSRLPSTTVGRESELLRLRTAWDAALHGERRVVFIGADAGIGKTALVDAFLAGNTGQAGAWVGRGQCIEQLGSGEAYLPVLAALGELCRSADGAALVSLLRVHAPAWLWQMPVFRGALSPEERKGLAQPLSAATPERMLREMTEALEAVAAARPFVLVLEDLHWSDTATLDLLAFLARRRGPARILVLCTYRPTEVILRDHPLKTVRHELQMQGRCEDLALGSLDERAVGDYLLARFPGGADAVALRALAAPLHRRTDGIALFVVGVVNDLLARGAIVRAGGGWEVHPEAYSAIDQVPASLREMIEQQLDRLGADNLALVEAAAVAGVEFSAAVVGAALEIDADAAEARCEALARRERLLVPRGSAEWPDRTYASRYGFVHALYRDVAYQRIPAGMRARLHLRIAERLRTAYGPRGGEIASELALHFEAGRDADRAARYCQLAADNALRRAGASEAAGLLARGLDLLATLPESRERDGRELLMQTSLGTALCITQGYVAAPVERAYARAWELCAQAEGGAQLLPIGGLYRYASVRGEHRKGAELSERMLRIAQSGKDRNLFLFGHTMLGGSYFWRGQLGPAREHLEQSREYYDRLQHRLMAYAFGDDPLVASLSFLSLTEWLQARPSKAQERIGETLELADSIGHPAVVTLARFFAAQLYRCLNDGPRTASYATQGIALATEHGLGLLASVCTILHGWALVAQQRTVAGLDELQRGLSSYRPFGADSSMPFYLGMFAEVQFACGRPAQALEAVREGLEIVQRTGECWWVAELHRLNGELGFSLSADVGLAQAHCERALVAARQAQAKALELRAAVSLARLLRETEGAGPARALLQPLLAAVEPGPGNPDWQQAAQLLSTLETP